MFGGGSPAGRGNKAPIGTQRFWESTGQTWIKSHDNGIFDDSVSAWMALPSIPQAFTDLFYRLDRLGSSILDYKEPIDAELWLDKEFEEFITTSGKKFTTSEFKKYNKFSGKFSRYGFKMELTRRYVEDKLKLNAKMAETLEEANEARRFQIMKEKGEAPDPKTVLLNKDEINAIKKEVREEFKYDESEKLTLEDVKEIESVLDRVLSYLEKGEDFEGEQAEVYTKAVKVVEDIETGPYRNIRDVKTDMMKTLGEMEGAFPDAWGVRESYKKRMDKAFSNYIYKYKKEIEETELEAFNKEAGVDLYAPTQEFYRGLETSPYSKHIDVDHYIGKIVPSPSPYGTERYRDVRIISTDYQGDDRVSIKYTDLVTGEEEERTVALSDYESRILASEIGSDLEIPLRLRMQKLYNKSLNGSFNESDIPLMETFETLLNYLPDGHATTNEEFTSLKKEGKLGDTENSYAHYNPNQKEIYMSSDAQKTSSRNFTLEDLKTSTNIVSVVLLHEIGHSVSMKLGRRGSLEYKKFVKECGWSWEQFVGGASYQATNKDPDIKRQGSKSDVPLITEYSRKSPEEAFAEYYSFYSSHKARIDHYLKTGKQGTLEKDTAFALGRMKQKFWEHRNAPSRHGETNEEAAAILTEKNRSLTDHIKTGVLDPYYDNLETMKESRIEPGFIAAQKHKESANLEDPQPVFTVFDYHTGKHDIVGESDAHTHYANKYLRRLSPTYSISKESYGILKEKGLSHDEIRGFTFSQIENEYVPKVKEEGVKGKVSGLRYEHNLVLSKDLMKMKGIFKQMKSIWESDELAKALEELGFTQKDKEMIKIEQGDINEVQKGQLSGIFKATADKIKSIISKGNQDTHFGDFIVRNRKGEFLLLERTNRENQKYGGKHGPPGGHIEPGESYHAGAIRELEEETFIKTTEEQSSFVASIKNNDGSTSHYYEVVIDEVTPIMLDNSEHFRYIWVGYEDLDNYPMIFDFAERLRSLPLKLLLLDDIDIHTVDITDLFKQRSGSIDIRFDKGEIDEEGYQTELKALAKSKRNFAFSLIESNFNIGLVSEEDYMQAYINNR